MSLTIVVAARNDNYGGAFLERMMMSLNTLAELSLRHKLDVDVIIVEWNPPLDKLPLSSALRKIPGLPIRIVTVPYETHKLINSSDKMPIFEYIAKNTGIRRATGTHVLATNPDIILSEQMIKRLSTMEWDDKSFYRANRHDVSREANLAGPADRTLEVCAGNVMKIYYGREAGGDFILMSKENWLAIGGHPELDSHTNIDSYAIELAKYLGMSEVMLQEPIYHQDHDRSQRSGRPEIDWREEYYGKKNEHQWGLAGMALKESKPGQSSISILCPTRKRPGGLARMVKSARDTATNEVEIVCYVDSDDPEQANVCEDLKIKYVVGPRITLTDCWNKCVPLSAGDIFMQGNDDMVFRTHGWDKIVEEAFLACPDHILMVHGHDVPGFGHGEAFGPFPIVHRRWVEILGYFIAPYFSSDYGDAWVNDLANKIGRRKCLPFEIEHMHFSDPYKKSPLDETYRERLVRHDQDKVEVKWAQLESQRFSDSQLLKAKIGDAPQLDSIRQAHGVVPYVYPSSAPGSSAPKIALQQQTCPSCGSTAIGMGGGMRRCNQCGASWI